MSELAAIVLTPAPDTLAALTPLCGRPLIAYTLRALSFIAKENTILCADPATASKFSDYASVPREPASAACCRAALEALGDFDGSVLITVSDMPLIAAATYKKLLNNDCDCTVLYGTGTEFSVGLKGLLLEPDGTFSAIERLLPKPCGKTVCAGAYLFKVGALRAALSKKTKNLSSIPAVIKDGGGKVALCPVSASDELIGVKNTGRLEHVEYVLREKGLVF